jgi:phosphatidate cytidylyltransferase
MMQNQPKFVDLKQRVSSAIILLALVAFALFYHRDSFTMLLAIAGLILAHEWQGLNLRRSLLFRLAGYVYIGIAMAALYKLRMQGIATVLLLLAIVAATDIGAYFIGKIIGGRKLCPKISPNKTISGALGGIICALVTGAIIAPQIGLQAAPYLLYGSFILVSITAQIGDIFESSLKRRAGVKDAGKLLPGHGGLFDRVDGIMAAAPCFVLILWLLQLP